MGLPGDFVECGVNKGGFARTIIDYVDLERSGKSFFLFDTFKGLATSHLTHGERSRDFFTYTDCLDEVKRTFSPFHCVDIVPGTVPETLSSRIIDRVAFLSIDMNCVMPEIAAAEHFWPKLVSGAVMVLDDYGWEMHHEQKVAFDEFARSRGVSVLSLPTGQGLIFKP
jgi:O-methyltransferase